jgi:hypothetical protein
MIIAGHGLEGYNVLSVLFDKHRTAYKLEQSFYLKKNLLPICFFDEARLASPADHESEPSVLAFVAFMPTAELA